MQRLLRHFFQILILGSLFFLMFKLPLFEIKYFSTILTGLIVFLVIVWIVALFYKNRQLKIILFILGFSVLCVKPVYADFCGMAKSYEQRVMSAQKKNWSDDITCDDGGTYERTRYDARDYLDEKFKSVPSGRWLKRFFYPEEYKKGGEEAIRDKSYFSSPLWNKTITEKFKGDEDAACASLYLSMCSEYNRRHPTSTAKTVQFIMSKENTGCWPCKMAYIILTVIQKLSSDVSSSMQGAARNVLKIFILVWILFASMTAVVFPSKSADFLKKLMTNFIWISLAFLLLSSGSMLTQFYKSFLTPFISLGLGFSDEINNVIYQVQKDTFGGESFTDTLERNLAIQANQYCQEKELLGSDGNDVNTFLNGTVPDLFTDYSKLQLDEKSTLITPEIEVTLLCLTERMYNQFSPMVAAGQSLISFARSSGVKKFGFQIPNIYMWWIGISLWFFFTLMSFFVAFKIVDIFLKLGFALVLMPLFVATAVFKTTRFFTQKGFAFILNVIVDFLGLTICANFVVILIQTAYGENREVLLQAMGADYSKEYGTNLLNAFTNNQTGHFFWFLVGAFFLCVALFKQGDKVLTSILGGSLGKGIDGSLVGGATVMGVQQAYQKWGKPLGENAEKMEIYKAPQKEKKDDKKRQNSNQQTPSAKQNHFHSSSQEQPKRGENFHYGTQKVAEKIDNVGVRTGQFLQKAGNWAMAVPFIGWIGGAAMKATGIALTHTSKTLSFTSRGVGKIVAFFAQSPENIREGYQNIRENMKSGYNKFKNSKFVDAYKRGRNGKK